MYLDIKRCCKYHFPICDFSFFFKWVFSEIEVFDFNVVKIVSLCLNCHCFLGLRKSYNLECFFAKWLHFPNQKVVCMCPAPESVPVLWFALTKQQAELMLCDFWVSASRSLADSTLNSLGALRPPCCEEPHGMKEHQRRVQWVQPSC